MILSRLLKIARDRDGASLVEFAIVLPLLTIVLLGVTQFGIFFYDYATLENAAVLGERNFLQQRPFYNTAAGCSSSICPTSCFTPYSSTVSLIQTATAGTPGKQCDDDTVSRGDGLHEQFNMRQCIMHRIFNDRRVFDSANGQCHRVISLPHPPTDLFGAREFLSWRRPDVDGQTACGLKSASRFAIAPQRQNKGAFP